jgi:bifunctional non-homologous end joining protein LigD
MLKAFEFCVPATGTKVPFGLDWLHEIKYDGYRLRVELNGDLRVGIATGRAGMDHACRSGHLVLDQARIIRVRRNGPGRQKNDRAICLMAIDA